jgi:carbon monoxide dehydrogenase subunit G
MAADTFEVPLGVEGAWALLSDVGRVAAGVPGARVDAASEGEWRGEAAGYAGTVRVVERDEVDRRLVVALRGRNGRAGDAARATVTVVLHAHADGTRVEVDVDAGGDERVAAAVLRGLASGVAGLPEPDGPARLPVAPAAAGRTLARAGRRAVEPAACVLLGVGAGWLLGRRR